MNISSNVIRHLVHQFKSDASYWKAVLSSVSGDQEHEQFLSLLTGLEPWSVVDIPDKVSTVRCNRAVTL